MRNLNCSLGLCYLETGFAVLDIWHLGVLYVRFSRKAHIDGTT